MRLLSACIALLSILGTTGLTFAVESPSGVEWAGRHALALVSDDLGCSEYVYDVEAAVQHDIDEMPSGESWGRVARTLRGRTDGLGVQVPLTLYMCPAWVEPDFTWLSSGTTEVFQETFEDLSAWDLLGEYPPYLSSHVFHSTSTSLVFSTPTPESDGWARRTVPTTGEFSLSFWVELLDVHARTNIIGTTVGPLGRSMGLEMRGADRKLLLWEGFWYDYMRRTEVDSLSASMWVPIRLDVFAGRIRVDVGDDGEIELEKRAAILPTKARAVFVGDASPSFWSGTGAVDDLVFASYTNTYPDDPLVTPLDEIALEVADTVSANMDVFFPQSHGLTHANDGEIQRRYAAGLVADYGMPEANWWREFYDLVNDTTFSTPYQLFRVGQMSSELERLFGSPPRIHVSGGNVFGGNTDSVLWQGEIFFHETDEGGVGQPSPYHPGVFWAARSGQQELYYRQPDPDPEAAAAEALSKITDIFAGGRPAIMNTHAFNAVVGDSGIPLATFYESLLDTLVAVYPDLVTLTDWEMVQLQRDGQSVGIPRDTVLYARNYLDTPHEFAIDLGGEYEPLGVTRLNDGTPRTFSWNDTTVTFTGEEGDYALTLAPLGPTVVEEDDELRKPRALGPGPLTYLNVFPTPANPELEVEYELTAPTEVVLEVFDPAGRRVVTLVSGRHETGVRRVAWNGRDGAGRAVASGIYFVRLAARDEALTRKVILAR